MAYDHTKKIDDIKDYEVVYPCYYGVATWPFLTGAQKNVNYATECPIDQYDIFFGNFFF